MATDDVPDLTPPAQTPLFHALEEARYSRQHLLRQIEKRTGRRLIALVGGASSSITARDIPPFVDLLHDVAKEDDLDLLLHTPGGDVDQAERIVMMCRKRIGPTSRLRIVVPDSAKSAGTLIALASDEIVMGYCSELGPIDPQITITTANGETMARPAQSFLDGLNQIVEQVGEANLSPAYFPLLDKLDPALIDFCKKAILRSERFATEHLSKHMLNGDLDAAKDVASFFNNQSVHLSHGAVIDADKVKDLGLNVTELAPDDEVWLAYWALYCRLRLALPDNGHSITEGRKTSLIY